MKRVISLILVLVVTMFVFSFSGCGGKDVGTIQGKDAPKWVKKGSGAFDNKNNKLFHGVGSAYGIKNPPLLRTTADNRATNAVGKVFKVYTASLMKDYMAATIATDPSTSSEEQHVEQALKTVTTATLSGVEIIDHWQDPDTKEFFSLARLDMEAFMNKLNQMKELNAKVKEHIKANANRLHDELAKEEAKAVERED